MGYMVCGSSVGCVVCGSSVGCGVGWLVCGNNVVCVGVFMFLFYLNVFYLLRVRILILRNSH